uniref:Secreted protein n=1 Tax=Treubia lacunosa TaxID=93845 RepID=G4Y9R5_9MARC|nr:hypothetical protein TrlaMp16 [Treubia lacunosa]AEH99711.1 hypothetical protein TrlaMp16 [Treubia lacunosa]
MSLSTAGFQRLFCSCFLTCETGALGLFLSEPASPKTGGWLRPSPGRRYVARGPIVPSRIIVCLEFTWSPMLGLSPATGNVRARTRASSSKRQGSHVANLLRSDKTWNEVLDAVLGFGRLLTQSLARRPESHTHSIDPRPRNRTASA